MNVICSESVEITLSRWRQSGQPDLETAPCL